MQGPGRYQVRSSTEMGHNRNPSQFLDVLKLLPPNKTCSDHLEMNMPLYRF